MSKKIYIKKFLEKVSEDVSLLSTDIIMVLANACYLSIDDASIIYFDWCLSRKDIRNNEK